MPFSLYFFTLFAIACGPLGMYVGDGANATWNLSEAEIAMWNDNNLQITNFFHGFISFVALVASAICSAMALVGASETKHPSDYFVECIAALLLSAVASAGLGFNFGYWSGLADLATTDVVAVAISGWGIILFLALALPVLTHIILGFQVRKMISIKLYEEAVS